MMLGYSTNSPDLGFSKCATAVLAGHTVYVVPSAIIDAVFCRMNASPIRKSLLWYPAHHLLWFTSAGVKRPGLPCCEA